MKTNNLLFESFRMKIFELFVLYTQLIMLNDNEYEMGALTGFSQLSILQDLMIDDDERVEIDDPGLHTRCWKEFIASIKGGHTYVARIKDFLFWKKNQLEEKSMADHLVDYFYFKHEEKNDLGEPRAAPTSLRSWLSMFKKFWMYGGYGELKEQRFLIENRIHQWEKNYVVTQSPLFTKENIGNYSAMLCLFIYIYIYFFTILYISIHAFTETFFNLPDTPEILLYKAYTVIALCFAGRGCEIYGLYCDQLYKTKIQEDGTDAYILLSKKLKSWN